MAGRLSELNNNLDVDDDLDEFEHRDVSDTPDNNAQNKTWTLGDFKGILSFKQPVRAATTVAGTLASSFENGDSIDGVSLVTGDRILIKNQASGDENGIYTVNALGAPTRALDFNTSAKVKGGMSIPVQEGTVNANTLWILTNNGTIVIDTTALIFVSFGNKTQSIIIAISDETTDLTTGTAKVKFRMPFAFKITEVRASLSTVATGATLVTVDINESGSTILSTKLTFDASESTTTTAATPPVVSDSLLADDAEITIDIDAVGNTTTGKGLKVTIIGFKTP